MKFNKDYIDSLTILNQADLIKSKALEIKKKQRTIPNGTAFKMAIDIVLKGINYNL